MSESTVHISSKEQFQDILKASSIVVADFFADRCAPCEQIAPLYETLSQLVSRPDVTFVKIDNDKSQGLAQEYGVTVLPTFILFRNTKVLQRVQGANPTELNSVVEKLAEEILSLGEGAGGDGDVWKGDEVPRGYSDITDQVEIKGCELLNADEDAGPVKVLFETSKPSALGSVTNASKDWVQSGSDDQLLLFVPFKSTIKLHTLQITSLPSNDDDDVSRPSVIHLFINRTSNMDFGEAEDAEPTQAVTLEPKDWNAEGTANISLRFVKFQKTTTLTVFIQKGDGEAETVRIDRMKIIGEAGIKWEMGKLQKINDED